MELNVKTLYLVGGIVMTCGAGAALLTAADSLARFIPATTEIKTGVVTALVGVPFLLWRIFGERRLEAGA